MSTTAPGDRVARVDDDNVRALACALPLCAWCGSTLPEPLRCTCGCTVGRRRRFCSDRCRRLHEVIARRLARRVEWLTNWRRERGRGIYPDAQVELQVDHLTHEIDRLERVLRTGARASHPGPATPRPAHPRGGRS